MNLSMEDLKKLLESDRFLHLLGIKVQDLKKGYCRIKLELKEELTRYGNMLNGGVTATLADAAGGGAVLSVNEGKDQLTVNLSISYLLPIRSGPVIAEARVVKSGKSLCFVDITIFDGTGAKCAVARGTWFFKEW